MEVSKIQGMVKMVEDLNDRLSLLKNKILNTNQSITTSHSSPDAKTLIISTGDISDVDGFIALAKYAQSGADVLFIMNYPAYLDPEMTDGAKVGEENGLGYKFTTETYLSVSDALLKGNDTLKAKYSKYSALRTKYQKMEGNSAGDNYGIKRMITDLSFTLAFGVWDAVAFAGKGKLYFNVGGINSMSPFAAKFLKNEMFVYADFIPENRINISCDEDSTYNSQGITFDLETLFATKDQIYMDFNGSMAFYGPAWRGRMTHLDGEQKLKAVFVMGGVFSFEKPKTMPKLDGNLNRFSCATMNQLYSPKKTAQFFDDMRTKNIPVSVIANNVVEDVGGLWKQFLISNKVNSTYLEKLASTYYTNHYSPPKKVFDFYTALALTKTMQQAGSTSIGEQKHDLHYDNEYGVCFISKKNESWGTSITDYYSRIDRAVINTDSEFIKMTKTNFEAERAFLTEYRNTKTISVHVVEFDLTMELFIKP